MIQFAQYGSFVATSGLIQIAQMPGSPSDPLINRGSDIAIYAGLALLAVALTFAIGIFNAKLEHLLIAAFSLCGILAVILWYL
ncbi:MAG: hypothetical protein WBB01_07500 [Phormidesmis sp.]